MQKNCIQCRRLPVLLGSVEKLKNAKYILINIRGRSFLYHAADKRINLQLNPYLFANFCWCIYSCRLVVEPASHLVLSLMHVSTPVNYTASLLTHAPARASKLQLYVSS